MKFMRYIHLIFFLIFLGTALSIYFVQLGMLKVNKSTLANRLTELHMANISHQRAQLIRELVPDQTDNVIERRANEYKQHKIRTKTDITDIIIAPANSPLKYPITGFMVAPLKKSLIPGLALKTQERDITTNNREVYKVSLSVNKGVLSVKDLLDGDQVEGQGQSNLTISSSNITHLNDLLSRVTYTSTIYHIRTSDLGYFSFEDYKAIFPIMIKRPSIPVLYDPGQDINSKVTIVTKTFLRYKELNVLIQSIRKSYPEIKIIVADDSLKPERLSGNNIDHYIMPPAQGWFAGRNLVVSQLTTKYFLWVDDDFVFLNETRIESFVKIMEANPELDILGGEVSGEQFYFIFEYDNGDESEGGFLRRIRGFHQSLPNHDGCVLVDGVINFFLARTDAVQGVGFDPFLKRVAHSEFFIDALGKLMVASCKGLCVGHQAHQVQFKYDFYRIQGKHEEERKLAHLFFKNYLNYIKY
ncbi:beta-1,4 N-acetylgalactosaminyltransferase 1-like [Puntigrus tetrazona]|uniref:beta-1,4 N-acetylgalactosaminyltransferase 1-like n=1 Tax=Puntigrus tetrazona TaxID=1606681 RepID=UPI001C8AFEAB|nr:beta-1,4 N-acetylgalactosaminyltransferase 1-like [Puntigrus tetrazona]